ncbi:AraC family transcriptional regulator [Lacticaseibacillus kribbianus]|uniref:AraC family transcriptional regulator n=1 Tax=Lacticaseibacillus kribbianus TaxID=2926292 RepID=UPI001CD3B587|nr:AraC family transcriptional regulator [Lacticaseibacillus kribbianus]
MDYFWYQAQATHRELNLTECGYQPCSVLDHYTYQAAQDYVFHYVVSGRGTAVIDGVRRDYKPGELFGFRRGQVVDYWPAAGDPWTYAWVAASGTLVDAHFAAVTPALLAALPADAAAACGVALAAVTEVCRPVGGRELQRLAALMGFLDVLAEALALPVRSADKAPTQRLVTDTLAYLHTHYQLPVTVAGLAARAGVSRGYLTREFKAAMHVTPQQYLLRLRLAQASHLLRTTTLSVQAVAAACGYPDPLYFSTQFKRVYLMSPRAFRRANGAKKD